MKASPSAPNPLSTLLRWLILAVFPPQFQGPAIGDSSLVVPATNSTR